MFEYDERGNKIRKENYQPKKVHFNDTVDYRQSHNNTPSIEHYGEDNKKCPKWIIIGLGVVAALLLIILAVSFFKGKKNVYEAVSSSPSNSGAAAEQRFGFVFY